MDIKMTNITILRTHTYFLSRCLNEAKSLLFRRCFKRSQRFYVLLVFLSSFFSSIEYSGR